MSGDFPVWVDGEMYDNCTEVCEKFGFKMNSFKMGLYRGSFKGHVVSKVPPVVVKVEEIKISNSTGRLLRGEYCTHRLGVFRN